jgi:hypothetical protein
MPNIAQTLAVKTVGNKHDNDIFVASHTSASFRPP